MIDAGLYASATLLGLAGSLHCAAMCGPIYVAISGFYETPKHFFAPLAWQLLGKTIGYTLLGFLFGFAGKGLSVLFFQNTLMIVSGILLLAIGVNGFLKFRVFTGIENHLNRGMGRLLSQKKNGSFLLGVLNGFVPCGLVYAAGLGAMATGSPDRGMAYMALFGIGTMPILVFSAFSRWLLPIRKTINNRAWKQIPVLILGVLFLLKGMGAGIPYLSPDISSPSPQKNCCTPKAHNRQSDVASP